MKRYLSIALLACLALSMSARDFEVGEKMYFNAKPASYPGWKDGTSTNTIKLWGRLVNSTDEYWIEAQWYGGDNCYLEIPNDGFLTSRSWNKLVLYRCDYYNRNDVKLNTGEIDIDASYAIDKNYIQNFYYDDGGTKNGANWWSLTFTPIETPTGESVDGVAKEVMEVCKSSVGDPLSLQPILAGDPLMYDYNHSAAHAWFKWNGSAWTALDGQSTGFYSGSNAWGYEGGSLLKETIGAAGSSTLYFLWTEKPSRRRFLEVDVTEDCSATLEITDFGVVISNLDVDNSTYTLDGIVAFNDEAVTSSTLLRISVTDAKGEHHIDYPATDLLNPLTTPFVFHLPGLYADGATGLVAKAEFVGTGYSKLSKPYTAPDASDVEIVPLEQAYGETTTFTAPGGEDGFKWNDGLTSTTRTVPAYDYDETVKYTYYDYEKLPAKSGDLIKNGDFSDASFDYGTPYYKLDVKGSNISEYNYWGKDVTSSSDFYDDPAHKDGGNAISGGMSIIKDANKFWKRYTKKISPKKETHYALFDADNSGSKKAWHIVTNATTQPDLKLAKGTNYLFSFWVANINNYGEMNNAAKLQFAIRYKQGGSWSAEELLGNPIDLNDYLDNIWHQNSYVYTAPADADEVEIMVRDLNASANPGGNDFALDDIRFSPIVAVTPAAKSIKRYVVTIYEPPTVVNTPEVSITQYPTCGSTDFEMEVTVSYSTLNNKITPITLQLTDNIYGDLFATPITIDPAVNPNSITLTLNSADYPMLVADGATHKLTAKITRINGKGADKGGETDPYYPATYIAPGVPALSVTQPTVPDPGCNVVTYDLDVTTTFAYQKGTQLLFYWGDILKATQDIDYGPSTSTTITLTNLPYDGEDHTLLVKTDNTTLDCSDSKTVPSPHQPVIHSVTKSDPAYVCDEDQYHVTLTVNYTNALGDKIFVKKGTDVIGEKKANTGSGTKKTTLNPLDIDFGDSPNLKVYFEGHEDCPVYVPIASPVKPALSATAKVINANCNRPKYDLEVTVKYTNQNGKLHVDVDGTAADDPKPGDITEDSEDELTYVAVVKDLPADGGTTHTLNVSFDGDHGCLLDPIPLTDIPHQPVINTITKSDPAYVCGEDQYHVTLKVNYTNALSDKICIKKGTDVIKVATHTGTDTKDTEDITLDIDFGDSPNLKVYFEGHENCAEERTIESPAQPALSVISKNVINANCNRPKYDLEVTVKYTNQNGKLHVDVDGTAADDPKPGDITEDSEDELTYVAVVKDLPADGGTTHTLNVSFDGDHGCLLDPIPLTDIPHQPVINSITPSDPAYVCGENQYHVTLKVYYTNALGKKICVKEGTEVIKEMKAKNSADKDSTIIPLDLDFGADHNLKVYFEGHEEDCAEELTIESPARPALKVTPNVIKPDCDVTTYSLRLDLQYTNQRGATIYANVDGGTDVTKANAFVSVMEQKEDFIQIDGLIADGKSHKFNLRFDDDDCDALNVAFNAPFGPKISDVTITPAYMKCGETAYKVTVNATLSANAIGKTLTVTGDTGDSPTTYTVASTSFSNAFTVNKADATGKFRIYFADAENCESQKTKDYTYSVPTIPTFSVNPVIVPTPDCDVTTFDLSISGTYSNLHGNQLEFLWDGVKKTTQSITPLSSGKVVATITGIVYDDKTHELTVKSNNTEYDNCPEVQNVPIPFSPYISGMKVTPTQMKCGVTTYDVKVTFTVANGQGKKVTVSGKGQTKSFTSADGENTVTFKDVSVSDATPDQFEIWFAENTACTTHKVATYTKPVVPVISVAAPTYDSKDCDKNTYTLKAVVTYTNQNGTLYAWLDNDAANKTTFEYKKDKTTSDKVTIVLPNLVGDGAAHQLNIEFDGSKGCRRVVEDKNAIPFTAPFTPVISGVTITPASMKCGETAYKITIAATLSANAVGKTLTVTGDTGESPTTYTVASTSFSHQFTVNKADATGKFRIYFADAENCESQKSKDYTYTVPTVPNLSINTVTAPNPTCDATTFDLSISGTYSNLHGNQLEFLWDGVKKTTQSITPLSSGKVVATITGIVYDDKTHELTVKSNNTEYDNCPEVQSVIVPFSPSITNRIAAEVQPYTCGDSKYKVKVTVPFENGQGHDLIIEDWNGKKQSIPTTAEDTKKEYMFEYAWEAPTTHAYKVYFVDAEGCADSHTPSFDVPLWHHIDSVTVVSDATVPCNDPSFNAVVTVEASYDITGVDLVLTYDDNGAKDTTVTATGKITEVPLKLHTIEGPDQTVTVAFKADPTCGKTSDAFTPAKRAGCHKDPATVCEGDTYTWFDQDYTLPVGVYTITHGYDSLFLTVKATPHITLQAIDLTCEDVASIALPYTVVDKGEPNTFAVTVDGVAQTIIGVTATDILIPSCAPGPHHAKVTVGIEGIVCEDSAEVDFTVALANQVYSKWTDVLFVNNKDERYTAYQWFADNKALDGETQQRLYDPRGLSGNNVIYFCQLTTTDGKTYFTCPQAFDDVTPSRTQDTGEKKVQSTRIYDNMGRSISGTPTNGIYIIVEQLEDGDVQVRKIAVYE